MKLNYKRTVFVGLAFMSICTFWQLYDNIIPLILLNTFHLKDTTSGFIMSLDNILALFMLPLFGAFSDKIDTKIGKRMPFILGGTMLSVVFIILIPISANMQSFSLFVVALLLTLIALGTYRSPAVALMPDVTPKELRSSANAIINLMGAVGGVITLLLIKFLAKGTNPNYLPLFMSVAAIMIISVALLFVSVKEKQINEQIKKEELRTPKKTVDVISENKPLPRVVLKSLICLLLSVALWFMGYNAVTTAFSKYTTVYWGMSTDGFTGPLLVGTVAAIFSYIPIGFLSSKFGRKKMIMLGIILLGSCYLVGFSFKAYTPLLNVMFALVGFAWAAINVNSYPMITEMSKGSDIGKYTGLYYTFSMSAQIVTPILSGFLLEHVGYFTLFPYAAICVFLALVTMSQVKHGDSRPTKRSALESIDFED